MQLQNKDKLIQLIPECLPEKLAYLTIIKGILVTFNKATVKNDK